MELRRTHCCPQYHLDWRLFNFWQIRAAYDWSLFSNKYRAILTRRICPVFHLTGQPTMTESRAQPEQLRESPPRNACLFSCHHEHDRHTSRLLGQNPNLIFQFLFSGFKSFFLLSFFISPFLVLMVIGVWTLGRRIAGRDTEFMIMTAFRSKERYPPYPRRWRHSAQK